MNGLAPRVYAICKSELHLGPVNHMWIRPVRFVTFKGRWLMDVARTDSFPRVRSDSTNFSVTLSVWMVGCSRCGRSSVALC